MGSGSVITKKDAKLASSFVFLLIVFVSTFLFLNFTSTTMLAILTISGTMLSMTATAAIFMYNVSRIRSQYWMERFYGFMEKYGGRDKIPDEEKKKIEKETKPDAIKELEEFRSVVFALKYAAILLLMSIAFSAISVSGHLEAITFFIGKWQVILDTLKVVESVSFSSLLASCLYLVYFIAQVLRFTFVDEVIKLLKTF
jgi:hypothetical protein